MQTEEGGGEGGGEVGRRYKVKALKVYPCSGARKQNKVAKDNVCSAARTQVLMGVDFTVTLYVQGTLFRNAKGCRNDETNFSSRKLEVTGQRLTDSISSSRVHTETAFPSHSCFQTGTIRLSSGQRHVDGNNMCHFPVWPLKHLTPSTILSLFLSCSLDRPLEAKVSEMVKPHYGRCPDS